MKDTDYLQARTPQMEAMRTQGYSIVRNVLEAERVAALKTAIESYFHSSGGRTQYGGRIQLRALHIAPEVARLLLTGAVADVIRDHTPEGMVLLTGECDMMMNTTSSWHKDITPDMKMGNTIFNDPDFAVYKIAIYLQDQDNGSVSAFRVRPGTQYLPDGSAVSPQRLETRAGDVVIFDVRMDHAGQPPSFGTRMLRKALARLAPLGINAEAALTRLRGLAIGKNQNRVALFMTFGPDNAATHAYEAAGRHRHGPAPAPLAPPAEDALRHLGLGMIPTH